MAYCLHARSRGWKRRSLLTFMYFLAHLFLLDPSAMDYVGFRAARCRAGLADWLFGPDRGILLNDVPGTGAWNTEPFPPDGWREQLGWTPPV